MYMFFKFLDIGYDIYIDYWRVDEGLCDGNELIDCLYVIYWK